MSVVARENPAFAELHVSTLPDTVKAGDAPVLKNTCPLTESIITEKPSFYMDRNVYGSFIRDPVGIKNRNLPGGRNIMWSTDYPHSETTWPDSRAVLDWQFAGLTDDERRPIVHDNAVRFFGLG